jgi:cytochrome c1
MRNQQKIVIVMTCATCRAFYKGPGCAIGLETNISVSKSTRIKLTPPSETQSKQHIQRCDNRALPDIKAHLKRMITKNHYSTIQFECMKQYLSLVKLIYMSGQTYTEGLLFCSNVSMCKSDSKIRNLRIYNWI